MAEEALSLRDGAAWRAWLEQHHGDSAGVWLVTAKKGAAGVSRDQALEEALCHGWIDGQARSRDDATYLQRYTPRRPRSAWSQRNTKIVERLTAEGRMHPAGLTEVERAKADGRWDAAYAGSATIEVPADLAEALKAEPQALAMFETLNSRNRYACCTGSRRPSGPRRAGGGSRSTSPCSPAVRRSTDHQGSRAALSVAHRGSSHSTGAATIAVAPTASAATPIESSA
jgi:uncharacterized protein YdeI (YjbR/CyaY-like superfamily)